MSVTLNSIAFEDTALIDFEISTVKKVQLPKWINETEVMETSFFNKEVSKIQYIVRVTDAQKWRIDNLLRNHTLVNLTDTIYGINSNVLVISAGINLSFKRNGYPWEATIVMVSDAI